MTPNELRKLLSDASPSPWEALDGYRYLASRGWWVKGPEYLSVDCDMPKEDAVLISLSPEIASILADAIDALEGVIAEIDWRSSTAENVIARFYALGNTADD